MYSSAAAGVQSGPAACRLPQVAISTPSRILTPCLFKLFPWPEIPSTLFLGPTHLCFSVSSQSLRLLGKAFEALSHTSQSLDSPFPSLCCVCKAHAHLGSVHACTSGRAFPGEPSFLYTPYLRPAALV